MLINSIYSMCIMESRKILDFVIYIQPTYSYSMQAIEFIVNEIKKDPLNIIENLKKTKK